MPSTKIPFEKAQEYLEEFDKAYRMFYRNSKELLEFSDNRNKTKTHDFYIQASKDVKALVNKTGFSNSWIWGLFLDQQLKIQEEKRRCFNNDYLKYFEDLIIFYQDHIFIKYNEDKEHIYRKNDDSSIISSKQKKIEAETKIEVSKEENGQTSEADQKSEQVEHEQRWWKSRLFLTGISIVTFLALLITVFVVITSKKDTTVNESVFKVVVLPFDQECIDDGIKKNVGEVITKRLAILKDQEQLDANIEYLKDFKVDEIQEAKSVSSYYDSILKANTGDYLIYGATRNEQCGYGDEVCLNYIFKGNEHYKKIINTDYIFQQANYSDISNGKYQELIDFHILYAGALVALNKRQYDIAEKLITRITESKKFAVENRIDALFFLGNFIHHQQGSFEKAIATYNKILELSPDNIYALQERTLNKRKCGIEYENDLKYLYSLDRMNPISNYFVFIQRFEDENVLYEIYFERVLNGIDDNLRKAGFCYLVGKKLSDKNEFELALKYHKLGLTFMETDDNLIQLAIMQYMLYPDDRSESRKNLKKIPKGSKYYSKALYYLGVTYALEDDKTLKDKAYGYFKKACVEEPFNGERYTLASIYLYGSGYKKEAMEFLDWGVEILGHTEQGLEIRESRMYSNRDLGNKELIIKDSLAIIKIDPDYFNK